MRIEELWTKSIFDKRCEVLEALKSEWIGKQPIKLLARYRWDRLPFFVKESLRLNLYLLLY